MHFSFLKDLFPQHRVDIRMDNGVETVSIRNEKFEDSIVVYYFPEDYYTYYLEFATQHFHTSSREELVEYAFKLANGQRAAVEFFEDGKNRFGGDIDTAQPDILTYDGLRSWFGYPDRDLSRFTFTVRGWDECFCLNGSFRTTDAGDVETTKEYMMKDG